MVGPVTQSVSAAGPFCEKSQEPLAIKQFGQYLRLFPHVSNNRHLKREEGADRPPGLIPDGSLTA